MLGIIPFVNVFNLKLLGTSVGEGTFGKVKLGKHILTGEKVILLIMTSVWILNFYLGCCKNSWER